MGAVSFSAAKPRLNFVIVHHQESEMVCSLKKQRLDMEKTVTEFYANVREISQRFAVKHREERKRLVSQAKQMKKPNAKYAWF